MNTIVEQMTFNRILHHILLISFSDVDLSAALVFTCKRGKPSHKNVSFGQSAKFGAWVFFVALLSWSVSTENTFAWSFCWRKSESVPTHHLFKALTKATAKRKYQNNCWFGREKVGGPESIKTTKEKTHPNTVNVMEMHLQVACRILEDTSIQWWKQRDNKTRTIQPQLLWSGWLCCKVRRLFWVNCEHCEIWNSAAKGCWWKLSLMHWPVERYQLHNSNHDEDDKCTDDVELQRYVSFVDVGLIKFGVLELQGYFVHLCKLLTDFVTEMRNSRKCLSKTICRQGPTTDCFLVL